MVNTIVAQLTAELLDEHTEVTLAELCRSCRISADELLEFVAFGVIEPRGKAPGDWRFQGNSIQRIQKALRLQEDLGVNLPGVALALELLDELEVLRQQVQRLTY